ncbi:hypothetical protein JCM8547_003190 [Rhodosporidiobolus lusitaniae]
MALDSSTLHTLFTGQWLNSPALSPPSWTLPLRPFIEDTLHFHALAPVVHLSVYACVTSFVLQRVSAVLSPRVFKGYYPARIEVRKRDDWDLHMVGWAFALFATPLALHCLFNPSAQLDVDPLYGTSMREQRLNAMAVGYFAWDAFVTAKHIRTQGLGFFLHGAGCFTAFLFTLKPFMLWCGPNFLIWELSTIFLNAHWLIDKLKMTGSKAQLINGLLLVSTYISARLLFGTYNSYKLWRLLLPSASDYSSKAQLARETQMWIRLLYLALNILMNGLNFFWFRLMILALLKRFPSSSSTKTPSSSTSSRSASANKPRGSSTAVASFVPSTKPVPDDVQKGKLGVESVEGRTKGE